MDSLFTDAHAARDEALTEVEKHAATEWKALALTTVQTICKQRERFTTDRVWALLDQTDAETHEPRALGAIMRIAARQGWCVATGDYRQSKRPACHARPIPIWRSLIHEGTYV